ncbi:unnamed protein product [Didymodactylos carnosus]|uniref:ELMO domain-containing protein n=1 Tax=Didymodactylos carnosus TaxID=1234261 RepID=A0A813UHD8_9BILA|nr:unnamed protein product [Didymodactylos carnosus]CAF3614600.1 unnamed protein product [Didymodactylos carnosus]
MDTNTNQDTFTADLNDIFFNLNDGENKNNNNNNIAIVENDSTLYRSANQHTLSFSTISSDSHISTHVIPPPALFANIEKNVTIDNSNQTTSFSNDISLNEKESQQEYTVEDEWSNIPTYVIGSDNQILHQSVANIASFDNIFFNDAKSYLFSTCQIATKSTPQIKQHVGFFTRLLNIFRRQNSAEKTADTFDEQCLQLLNLASHKCDMTDRVHIRILFTIYRRLTKSNHVYHSVHGKHWEDIGFQTDHPETDFRSSGLFSLLMLLYFVDSMYLPLATQIYLLSLTSKQQFPFCLIGINLANLLIKFLRQKTQRIKLKHMHKKCENITDTIGNLFIALFLSFYLQWKTRILTIEYTQQVLSQLEQTLMNKPKLLFTDFDNYFQQQNRSEQYIVEGEENQQQINNMADNHF